MVQNDNPAVDNPGVIAPPPLLALAAVGIGVLLEWLLPSYILPQLSWLARIVVALIIGTVALTVTIPAHLAFIRAGTHIEPWKPSTVLVTGGVFRWVRNPMYVALMLLLVILSVLFASDWLFVATVFFAIVLHFGVVKREERYLEAKFGEAYRRYRSRVPRYGLPPSFN